MEQLQATRNHYDRLVHFAFGALWLLPFCELSARHMGVPRRVAWIYALALVMAASLVYELFEYALALTLSPESAEAYNGQQGDGWDAQKDMALAVLGSLCALPVAWLTARRAPWPE
jgi:putative membrane protein